MHPIERELKTMRGFAACLHEVTYSEFVAAERKALSRVGSGGGLVVKKGVVVT